ncbi:hypothetical protein [Trichothermofontia sp.]
MFFNVACLLLKSLCVAIFLALVALLLGVVFNATNFVEAWFGWVAGLLGRWTILTLCSFAIAILIESWR